MMFAQIKHIKQNTSMWNTFIIDTADWAEKLCITEICAKAKKESIEDFGYGKGYTMLEEEFGKLLNALTELVEMGINVVFTAHAWMRKFEQPDEMGSYDRWEMKLQKKTAPLLREWADMVLFANYKTFVVTTDDKKKKAQGGNRVMHTTHHPCWDAKNRDGLPEELPFEFAKIAHIIPTIKPASSPVQNNETPPVVTPPVAKVEPQPEPPKKDDLSTLPKPLADLMSLNSVTVLEIQKAVASRGYYPVDTPIQNYATEFINGVLVGAWAQVFKMIQDNRDNEKLKEIVGF
jgi:hypothetical protein